VPLTHQTHLQHHKKQKNKMTLKQNQSKQEYQKNNAPKTRTTLPKKRRKKSKNAREQK
jgi:hypothetical protein